MDIQKIYRMMGIPKVDQLNEAKAIDIKDKYYKDIDSDTFETILRLDPSSKNGSSIEDLMITPIRTWLLNLYSDGKLILNNRELISRLKKNIENYYNSVNQDIKKTIEPKLKKKKNYSIRDFCIDIEAFLYGGINDKPEVRIKNNTEFIYEDEDWKVVSPMSRESSLFWGRNSSWCTAGSSSRTYFRSYSNEDKCLFIFINKKINNPKKGFEFVPECNYQMAISKNGQIKDFHDANDIRLDEKNYDKYIPRKIVEYVLNEVNITNLCDKTVNAQEREKVIDGIKAIYMSKKIYKVEHKKIKSNKINVEHKNGAMKLYSYCEGSNSYIYMFTLNGSIYNINDELAYSSDRPSIINNNGLGCCFYNFMNENGKSVTIDSKDGRVICEDYGFYYPIGDDFYSDSYGFIYKRSDKNFKVKVTDDYISSYDSSKQLYCIGDKIIQIKKDYFSEIYPDKGEEIKINIHNNRRGMNVFVNKEMFIFYTYGISKMDNVGEAYDCHTLMPLEKYGSNSVKIKVLNNFIVVVFDGSNINFIYDKNGNRINKIVSGTDICEINGKYYFIKDGDAYCGEGDNIQMIDTEGNKYNDIYSSGYYINLIGKKNAYIIGSGEILTINGDMVEYIFSNGLNNDKSAIMLFCRCKDNDYLVSIVDNKIKSCDRILIYHTYTNDENESLMTMKCYSGEIYSYNYSNRIFSKIENAKELSHLLLNEITWYGIKIEIYSEYAKLYKDDNFICNLDISDIPNVKYLLGNKFLPENKDMIVVSDGINIKIFNLKENKSVIVNLGDNDIYSFYFSCIGEDIIEANFYNSNIDTIMFNYEGKLITVKKGRIESITDSLYYISYDNGERYYIVDSNFIKKSINGVDNFRFIYIHDDIVEIGVGEREYLSIKVEELAQDLQ